MNARILKAKCPRCTDVDAVKSKQHVVRYGVFFRSCDREAVARYRCNNCRKTFSDATFDVRFRQRKRSINLNVFKSLCSTTSMRRTALNQQINLKTVARRLSYFEAVARVRHERFLNERPKSVAIQFDDMETSEHTKLKPLSIPLTVDQKTREILSFDVAQMPAKGLLAAVSRKKYGYRKDLRAAGWCNVLRETSRAVTPCVIVTSDSHKRYPQMLRENLPGATHIQKISRRACIAGQGELKVGGYDPLFSLNHTAASLRANICRLIRKTWCTTKRRDCLRSHIAMYVYWHNEWIDAKRDKRVPSFAF